MPLKRFFGGWNGGVWFGGMRTTKETHFCCKWIKSLTQCIHFEHFEIHTWEFEYKHKKSKNFPLIHQPAHEKMVTRYPYFERWQRGSEVWERQKKERSSTEWTICSQLLIAANLIIILGRHESKLPESLVVKLQFSASPRLLALFAAEKRPTRIQRHPPRSLGPSSLSERALTASWRGDVLRYCASPSSGCHTSASLTW